LATALLSFSVLISSILIEGLVVRLPITAKCKSPAERVGVIHVHTKASDGSGTVAEVMAAAEKADLSFIAITDHNVAMTDSDLAEDPPDLPIISGIEVGTASGHFIALGVPAYWKQPKTKDDRELLAAARAVGAFRVLAHPFHPYTPWTDWRTSDYDGIEIWNEDAAWRQNNFFELMDALLLYGENDRLALVRLASTPKENFEKWDQLLQQRPIVGICAADTHARIRLGLGNEWRFPAYEPSLRVSREHVLIPPSPNGQPATASDIVSALRSGHSYCGLDSLYPADGFTFRVSDGIASGGPGDVLRWTGAERLQITTPSGADIPLIKVFRDGQEIDEQETRTIDEPVTAPGRYRAEVFLRQPGFSGWRRWALWVFTNPIYVTAPRS
jgi:hypothetical protein